MPPKKKAPAKSKPSAKAEPEADVMADAPGEDDVPATETAEPPKEDAQPAEGDLKANDANDEKTGETSEDAKSAAEDVANPGKKGNDPVSKKIDAESSKPTKKRKNAAESKKPAKVPREGSRTSARGRASKSDLTPQQMLNYLLSNDAQELVRSENEKEDLKENPNKRNYPSSELNPFQELMCAMILSRPISHMLGLRTIRTVLNDPYNFTTPKAVKDVGDEKRLEAFYDAKTQHKEKSAAQIGQLAETVLEKYTSSDDQDGTLLKKVLQNNDNDASQALKELKNEINGFGDTGMDIFLRRVQWLEPWTGAYPFIDGKSQDALRELGLPQDHDDLRELLEEHWSKLDTKHLAGKDDAQKQRRAFVVLLERATGTILENKVNEVREAVASSS